MEATSYRLQDPCLSTLNLATSKHLKLYNKAIVRLLERYRYDLTRSKWTDFYQELEDDVPKFLFKEVAMILTAIYVSHEPTEFKKAISFYPSTTEAVVDSKCENLCDNTSVADLGRHPILDYGTAVENPDNHLIVSQQRIRYKMLSLWIKTLLATGAKLKLRAFKTSYTYNNQDNGAEMLFVVVKIVRPDTRLRCSDINKNLETMRMSHFKHDIHKANLNLVE